MPIPRTFAYLRVSTTGQTTGNQLQEIAAAGFKVEPRRVVTETISGNVATSQRRGFTRLLDRLETGDVLVVTKLDRLGRNVTHLGKLLEHLTKKGVALRILSMGVDTGTPTGKLMLNVMASVAQFEREMMLERQREGIAKAKGEGRYKGRKPTARARAEEVLALRAQGLSMDAIAARLGIGKGSVVRVIKGAGLRLNDKAA